MLYQTIFLLLPPRTSNCTMPYHRFHLGLTLLLLGVGLLPSGLRPASARAQALPPDDVAEPQRPLPDAAADETNAPDRSAAPDLEPAVGTDPTPHEEREQARAIFREGVVLHLDTLFARAADKYQEALDIWPHPAFSYNLALARIQLEDPIGAYDSLKRAVRFGREVVTVEIYENAQNMLKLLDGQLAVVEVSCDVPGAIVTFDGKPIFTAPGRETFRALPGSHLMMATKDRYLPGSQELVLEPGQSTSIAIAPRLPDPIVTVRRWPAWRPWAVTAGGAAVLVAAGILDRQAADTFDRNADVLSERCGPERGCVDRELPSIFDETYRSARSRRTLATGVYVAGGIAAATGIVLLIMNRERTVRRSATEATVSIHPTFDEDAVGLGARRSF